MKIICTLNLKGGCAKTTTAVSMAELLATGFKSKHGTVKPGKVLLFDNDKQGNASRLCGIQNLRTEEQRKNRVVYCGKGGERLKVSLDSLDEEIKKELENFNAEVINAANDSFRETAKEAAEMLKKGGPYQERTGAYTKDWAVDKRGSRTSVVTGLNGYSVYNKKHYQLTHLLENGHQSRKGGRVKAFSHIAPVNEQLGEMVTGKIESKLRG